MQLITYLGFTLVSILIQFCVMDFINESIVQDKTLEITRKVQTKQNIQAVVNRLSEKPHALFYRTDADTLSESVVKVFNNASLSDLTSTEMSSTLLDWVYDDNVTTTEDTFLSTDMFTSTEFENITEITLFEKKIPIKPGKIPKDIKTNETCNCNILYKICDINCCCDSDCMEREIKLFSSNCEEEICRGSSSSTIPLCGQKNKCHNKITTSLENLFCISKTNLPSKHLTDIQFDEAAFNRSPKWHAHDQQKVMYEFKNEVYKYQEPIWLLKNRSIFYTDIPITVCNNYCSGKKPMRFLVNEDVNCIVKLQDLHMFQVLSITEGTSIMSPVIDTTNSTEKNTSIHHTEWILFICDDFQCNATYNKSKHEPFCTDSYCNNIATTVEYNLYYYDSKIIKAVVKLYIEKVLLHHQFIKQKVKVRFYLSNKTEAEITKLSGNPGYIWNLPLIISTAERNHTLRFFNDTFSQRKFLTYPENKNGLCVFSNVTYKLVQFGQNMRSKCRYNIKQDKNLKNASEYCRAIQNNINYYLQLYPTTYVSPFGNPEKNEDWIKVNMFDRHYVYGILDKNYVLHCFNMVTRIAFVIAFADINSENSMGNKILHMNIEGTAQNMTFNIDDVSAVLTVDTNFIDASNSEASEYAGAPHLKFYLPKTFFLPSYTGNSADSLQIPINLYMLILLFMYRST